MAVLMFVGFYNLCVCMLTLIRAFGAPLARLSVNAVLPTIQQMSFNRFPSLIVLMDESYGYFVIHLTMLSACDKPLQITASASKTEMLESDHLCTLASPKSHVQALSGNPA